MTKQEEERIVKAVVEARRSGGIPWYVYPADAILMLTVAAFQPKR